MVADYFADAGHLDETIDLYYIVLNIDPSDLEAKTKLGVTYFLKGDIWKARGSLLEVAEKFDFRKSPAFNELEPIPDCLVIPARSN